MPVWLSNIRRLDRALGLILAFLASAVFFVAGLGVIIKSQEGGDRLFGVFLSLLCGIAMFVSFRRLKRLYGEAVRSDRQTCPNCGQEFTIGKGHRPEGTPCPYCGTLIETTPSD